MPERVRRDGSSETSEYSLRATGSGRDGIDCLVPPAYFRQPVPLQEVRTHYVIRGGDSTEDAVTSPTKRVDVLLDEDAKEDTKQNLLKALVGQPEHRCSLSSVVPCVEDAVALRLVGTHCNASHVASPQLMVQILSVVLSVRTSPERESIGCIASIDLSHTVLGAVGVDGPPLRFGADDNQHPQPATNIVFFPDEGRRRGTMKRERLDALALRSLALAYIAPLLWVPGLGHFRIRELVCRHCCLGDRDADALAFILRKRRSAHHMCVLEHIDLSFNNITDSGADALKKAVKYNRHVKVLCLAGNRGIAKMQTLDIIRERLAKNREGRSNLTALQHLKWLVKGR
ncbi:hypothetical protein DQ04_05471060 [Trypanosoma grayi]|uniref:hypothetical protein n=1 Tax=Trypanosoma grayi TaxID=71804 RepID=UPI0004F43918|nr:hypothetical protein DQ04_05471060 [Trypanosoma grayi]KEG09292.1 hypothetical protein DQ04_05471060 [Trypanosoma grayi]